MGCEVSPDFSFNTSNTSISSFFAPSPAPLKHNINHNNSGWSNGPSSPLDSSPSFLPDGLHSGPGKRQRKSNCIFPVPNLSLTSNQSPASSLATDLSLNFRIAKASVPTPRRSLFTSLSFSATLSESMGNSPVLPHKSTTNINPVNDKTISAFNKPQDRVIKTHKVRSLSNASSFFNSTPSLSLPLPTNNNTNQSSCAFSFKLLDSTPTPSLNNNINNGSMGMGNLFTPSPDLSRPTKFRRTQSMFQHPEDVIMGDSGDDGNSIMAAAARVAAVTVTSNRNSSPIILPDSSNDCKFEFKTFAVKEDPFRRIERETVCDVLDGRYDHIYDDHVIIDCRFEYEYKGGHIKGAINVNDGDLLEKQFLNSSMLSKNQKLLLIFHCEYSAHRGPRMAMHLRNRDRNVNMNRYPELYYPDIVILQGGYSHFFKQYYDRCTPQNYVGMNDSSHKRTCEREMNKFRRTMKFSGRSNTAPVNGFQFPRRNANIRREFMLTMDEDSPSSNDDTPTGTKKLQAHRLFI